MRYLLITASSLGENAGGWRQAAIQSKFSNDMAKQKEVIPPVQGVVDAYLTIKRKEGVVGGLYRGTVPNIGRNCIINVGETVVYDAVKVSH